MQIVGQVSETEADMANKTKGERLEFKAREYGTEDGLRGYWQANVGTAEGFSFELGIGKRRADGAWQYTTGGHVENESSTAINLKRFDGAFKDRETAIAFLRKQWTTVTPKDHRRWFSQIRRKLPRKHAARAALKAMPKPVRKPLRCRFCPLQQVALSTRLVPIEDGLSKVYHEPIYVPVCDKHFKSEFDEPFTHPIIRFGTSGGV